MIVKLSSVDKVQSFGHMLAQCLTNKNVIGLVGDLGVGKTTLAKSIGEGLAVTEPMNSPSYNIVNEYSTRLGLLVHGDVYRLEDEDALYDIGFYDYFNRLGVMMIEWADKIENILRVEAEVEKLIWIVITYHSEGRCISVEANPTFIKKLEAYLDDSSN